MKFWEVVSIWGRGTDAPRLLAVLENPDWLHPWGEAFKRFGDLDRSILDAPVPTALSERLARGDGRSWFLDAEGWLRATALNTPGERALNSLEVHDTYGGAVLEEVLEFGSFNVVRGRLSP